MTRTKKIVAIVLGVLVTLVVVAIIIIATFDWNRLKPTINEKASDALGRPFAINGDLSVKWQREPNATGIRSWVPWPHVTANDIVIANTDWGRTPNFATLERAYFSLSPLPLLAQRVVIRDIQLTRPWADLQRLGDGRANWEFAMDKKDDEPSEPSKWIMDINSIGFDQGRVGFADETLKADLEVLIDPLGKPVPFGEIVGDMGDMGGKDADAKSDEKGADGKSAESKDQASKQAEAKKADASKADDKSDDKADGKSSKEEQDRELEAAREKSESGTPGDYVFGWKVTGKYNNQKLEGDGKIGGMLTMRDSDIPFPVQADVRVGRTRAAVAGTVTDPMNFGGLDLKLALSGSSMADLYPLTGVTLPDTPPYKTDGRLIAQLHRPEGALFEYRGFNGAVGKSDLGGTLRYAAEKPRPKLTGNLSSRQLRLEDLGPLVGVDSGGAKPAPDEKKQPSSKALPVSEFRTERWNAMDANVRLKAGRIIHGAKLPLSDLNVHAIMDNGRLTLDPLRFGIAGGSINSTIALDGSVTPMKGRVKASARRMKLKQLFADASDMQRSLGEMNGDATLAGTGNSVSALMATSDGEVKLVVNDGVISRSLMEIAGLNVGNYVVTKLFGDDEVNINCAVADLGIRNGLLKTNAVLFDTENALVSVDGTVNFKNEGMDLDITPRSKGFRIFSLRSPLYVKGTFKNPDAGVQVLPLAARGAGMIALGALLTPVAGVLALIAPSAGDEQEGQCGSMLKQIKSGK